MGNDKGGPDGRVKSIRDCKFGSFTLLIEQCPRRKVRMRREYVPSYCAFLVATGAQFRKALDSMRDKWAKHKDGPPSEAEHYYETALRVIQHLIDLSMENVSADPWQEAVELVAKGFGIEPRSDPQEEYATGSITSHLDAPNGEPDASRQEGARTPRAKHRKASRNNPRPRSRK